jgi:hypothetical protein
MRLVNATFLRPLGAQSHNNRGAWSVPSVLQEEI